MGIRDLLQRIGSGTRNTIQRIPGGGEAFPLERNGTVNWVGNPMRGDNVLGSMVRGMTGIGAADDVLGAFRGGNSAPSAGMNPINVIPPSGRSGSVVAQGFVGRPSGIGGVSQRPSRPSRSEALGIGQMPVQIGRNDPTVDPSVSKPDQNDMRPYVGGGNGIQTGRGGRGHTVSSQRLLGAGALGSGGDAAMQDGFTALHNRRGLLAEF